MYLRPEENDICTAELIRSTTFTGRKDDLRERIRELGAAGFTHSRRHAFATGIPKCWRSGRSLFEGV